jgi:RimJ/RimL family protein N-acetyltransferase
MTWSWPFGLANKNTIVRSGIPLPADYPSELERPLALRSGARLSLRPIRPDDEPRLEELFNRLSRHTVYHRFFAPYHRLRADWYRRFANVDYRARLALVAEDERAGHLLVRAVARYEPDTAPGVAEVAVVVEDAWQNRGVGSVLLDAVLEAGETRGIRSFTANVLADNRRMLHVLRRLGEIQRQSSENGVVTVEFERRHSCGRLAFA